MKYGSFGQLRHLALFDLKKEVWKTEMHKLNQIYARKGRLCTNLCVMPLS